MMDGWRLALCWQIKVLVVGLSLWSSASTLQDRRGRAAAAGQSTAQRPSSLDTPCKSCNSVAV